MKPKNATAPGDQMKDTLLTPEEVSERLMIKVGTLGRWRYARRGPKFRKIGRMIRYLASDVEQWIRSRGVETELRVG
jgi:predicted DNA-binding transcriptional regulator AlpA